MSKYRSARKGQFRGAGRHPEKISEVMSRMLARTGYARALAATEYDEVWNEVAGPRWTRHSRPHRLRGGVLDVLVRNSTVLQELSFQKRDLLARMCAKLPQDTVRDIRFRVGEVDSLK